MNNQDFRTPMTPERMLSESDDDQPSLPSQNMPKIMDSSTFTASKRSEADPLSTLAMNLENSTVLKDGFDLDELKKKQEDLLLIQQMVQKNIEGIQRQIEKCAMSRESKSSVGGTVTPKYYKKFAESDQESSNYPNTKTFDNKRDLSQSFTRSPADAGYGSHFITKSIEKSSYSKTKKTIESTDEGVPPRSKSSMMPRRNRGDRKKSVQSIGVNRVTKYTKRSALKNKPASVFSIQTGSESQKQFTEVTTNESWNHLRKTNLSRHEAMNTSGNFSWMYSSNNTVNLMVQLKNWCKKFTSKHLSDLSRVNPTLPTIRIMFAIIKIMQSMGDKVRKPTDWNGILKVIHKKDKKLLQCLHNIPNKLDLISTDRLELMRYKTQCFGKGKISLTTISSSFQRECRPFANLFALVILMLQKIRKEKLELTQNQISIKDDQSTVKIEESSNCNETEGPFPKESCDESTGYYKEKKYSPSSSDVTPEQPKLKKSPVKRGYKSPKKAYVKKGYLSSDNQSTGSNQNRVNDYISPLKSSTSKASLKKTPSAVKKSVHLYNKKDPRSQKSYLNKFASPIKLSSSSAKSKRRGINSDSEYRSSKNNSRSPRIVKSKTSWALRSSIEKGTLSAPEEVKREVKPNFGSSKKMKKKRKPKQKVKVKENNPYETTDESEDPLHEQVKLKPRLRVYDKERDGGLLYAFLELQNCPKPAHKPAAELEKSGSYNPWESNFDSYQKTIVSTSLTGFARQSSENTSSRMNNPTSLSQEDYQKVLELKNKRMKTLLGQKQT